MRQRQLCITAMRRHDRSDWRRYRRCHAPPAMPVTSALNSPNSPFPWDVEVLLRRCPNAPETLPMNGRLLRGALTPAEQQWLYDEMRNNACPGSEDMLRLQASVTPEGLAQTNPKNIPLPLVTWCHPYARRNSTIKKPTHLLLWAQQLMHRMVPATKKVSIDSMLAQLYAPGGSLKPHRDENLSWGVSISLGSAATFDCLPKGAKPLRVTLRSGDIVVAEFGLLEHAVATSDEAPPGWWPRVDHFRWQRRCNILFRQALSAQQQRELCEERAQKVHGMSIAKLCQVTGKDEAFFIGLLAQLSL